MARQLSANRRQDDDSGSDYDDMSPKASEAQHNQDDNNGDGYGEAENGKFNILGFSDLQCPINVQRAGQLINNIV